MKDGEYVIYVVQHRRTHESVWGNPKSAPVGLPVDEESWAFSSFDAFGKGWEPHHGKGNDWRPVSRKSHDELHAVYHKTGHHGYFTLSYGLRALKRLHKASGEGKFDSRDSYGSSHQAVRHEFRLVKLTMSQKTEEVDVADVVEAL